MQRKVAQILVSMLALIVGTLTARAAYERTSMDEILLRTDAIIFATVSGIESTGERTVSISFSNVDVVRSRWQIDANFHLNARGQFQSDGSVRVHYGQPALKIGTRYLLFLLGGDWTSAPLITLANSVYPLNENGNMLCAGGFVYGLSLVGLRCMREEMILAKKPTEQELRQAISDWDKGARVRRPERARQLDAAARPPSLVPLDNEASSETDKGGDE